MADEALLGSVDTTEIDTSATTDLDTGVDQDTGQDGGDPAGGAQGADGAAVSSEPMTAAQLWNKVKGVEALDKDTRRQIQNAIHKAERLEGKFPGGADKAAEHLAAIQKLADAPDMPIERVLEETAQERAYFRELDEMFTKGSPEFVNKMSGADPNAFQAMMPTAFTKLAELNPAGFAALVTEPIVQSMDTAGLSTEFAMLKHLLPQLPEGQLRDGVIDAINKVFLWTQNIRSHAAKGYQAKKIEPAAGTQQQGQTPNEVESLKLDNARMKWNSAVSNDAPAMIKTETARLAAGKVRLTDADHAKISKLVGEEVNARLQANTDYGKAMQGFLKAGNQSGYLSRVRSEYKKLIPGATKRAYDDVVAGRKTKPANNGQQTTKQGATRQQTATAGTQQGGAPFERIAGPPSKLGLQVDYSRTTNKMMVGRQAYLKGREKPVTWAK